MGQGAHILFYDGTCKFCDRFVQLGLRHDRARLWRYSPLQSDFATRELARFDINAADLDSVHALIAGGTGVTARVAPESAAATARDGDATPKLLSSSDAAAFFYRTLSGWPRPLGWLLTAMPRFIREPLYRLIARNRYRLFGRYETCKVPMPEQRDLFLE